MNVVAERPQAPAGYGYSTDAKGMLAWDAVRDALASATLYWIATRRPDGSPHLHPIWGGWVGHPLYFEGSPTTRWGRNLADDPRVSFGAEATGLHINGRGIVERGPAGDEFAAVVANYGGKYEYRPGDDLFYKVIPEVVIALNMSSMADFANSPTRFRFEP